MMNGDSPVQKLDLEQELPWSYLDVQKACSRVKSAISLVDVWPH